jgi:hypothetical protein
MSEFDRFGATLQPLVRQVWDKRLDLFRTKQLTINEAFRAVYAMYAECSEHFNHGEVAEFAEQLQSYAKECGYKTKEEGDFIFCHFDLRVLCTHRIYINTLGLEERLCAAYCLMKELKTLQIVPGKSGCEFKVCRLNDSRADNIVVYVANEFFMKVREKILKMAWAGCLRNGVPAGTKKLRDGIGWAEQPGGIMGEYSAALKDLSSRVEHADMVSFGGVVSACIVLGLNTSKPADSEAWDKEADKKKYCDGVVDQLKLVGIDTLKPHKTMSLYGQTLLKRLAIYYKDNKQPDLAPEKIESVQMLRLLVKEALELEADSELPAGDRQ